MGNDGFCFSSYHPHSPKTCASVRTSWSPESCHPSSVNYSFNNFTCSFMLSKGLRLAGSGVACSVSSQAHVLAMEPSKEVVCSWGFFCFLWACRTETVLGWEEPSETVPSLLIQVDTWCFYGERNGELVCWKCVVVVLPDISEHLIHLFLTHLTMCECKSWSIESSLL